MCILSAAVSSVSNTNLFVAPSEDGSRQIIVYSNSVDSQTEHNTMVLPVPNPHSVEFINLKPYGKFFSDCERSFKYQPSNYYADSLSYRSAAASITNEYKPLPMFDVGSYKVSIVPTVEDFARLDPLHFDIHDDLPRILGQKYDGEFGYLVCKLRQGHHSYHPFAYSHTLHSCNLMFVPTFHIHLHGGAMPSLSEMKWGDWDHTVYSFATDLEEARDYTFSEHKVKWEKLPPSFRWVEPYRMKKFIQVGEHLNCDLWLAKVPPRLIDEPALMRTPQPPYNYKFPVFGEGGLRNLRRAFRE